MTQRKEKAFKEGIKVLLTHPKGTKIYYLLRRINGTMSEEISGNLAKNYSFKEIRTPMFEHTSKSLHAE